MKKYKKMLFNVQCAFDEKHIFPKSFDIDEGTENETSEVEAFCPFCKKQVTVTVQGKVAPNESLLRKFNQSEQ